jgi:Domain of unknown function (DUF4175)
MLETTQNETAPAHGPGAPSSSPPRLFSVNASPQSNAPLPAPPAGAPARSPGSAVERFVDAVRRRQRRAFLLQGALLGAAAFVLALLGAALLASSAPLAARGLLAAGALAALGLLCWRGLFHARRSAGDQFRTARLVAARLPGVNLDLLAALELRAALGNTDAFSQELARAYLAGTDQRAATLDARHVVDARPTRAAVLLAVGALVLLGLGALLAPQGLRPLAALFRRADARSASSREPITGDVELTYRYPAYLGLLPRTVAGSGGEVSAPLGTVVELRTHSDRPVAQAGLLVNGEAVPLRVEHERDLSGSFVLRKSGSYAVAFYGRTGRELVRGPDVPITAEADAPPTITLLLPASDLEVDADAEVVLRWEATDDHGLSALALVYQPPGGKETRVPLPLEAGKRSLGTWRWPLSGLKLAAGARVSYFLEALDNNAVDGPQKGTSRAQTLHVYSAAEHRQEALRKVEALWERMVTHLADRMEGPDRARTKDLPAVTAQGIVDESGHALAGDMVTTARLLGQERDRVEALVAGVANIGERLGRSVHTTQDARRVYLRLGSRPGENDPAARLARAASEEIAQTERDVLYLESLLDRQRLEELHELNQELSRDQRELAQLIERFQQTHDPALREQMLKQVDALRQRMNELMKRSMAMARSSHDEHMNPESFGQGMTGALDDIEKLLREGKTAEALAKLQQLQAQTDGQMRKADEQLGQVDPELVKRFRDFADALKDTHDAQARVAAETKRIRDHYREQLRERLKEKGEPLKSQIRKDIEAVAQDYKKTRPGELGPRSDRSLENAQSELENLKSALHADDFDLAAEAARMASQAADEIARDAEQQHALSEAYRNPGDVRDQSKRMAQRMEQDAQKLHDIQRSLQQLFPPAASQLSAQDRQRLQQLGQEQRGLERREQDVAQKMEQLNKMAPLFGEQGMEQLERIGEHMSSASERLEGKDPGRGYGDQKSALDGLEQLQQQLQDSQRGGGRGGGLPLPMFAGKEGEGGNEVSQQKVEIPEPDPATGFQDFRKDLLDAMKQGTPERYREQVKSYYEELVK